MSTVGLDPPITSASEPYWDATREQRLQYQWCDSCSAWVHYPRPRCPHCLGTELSWRTPPTDYRLYSWALHRAIGEAPPRMVALVQIDDGLRVLANLVDPDNDFGDVCVDHPLELVWTPLEDGRHLVDFRLSPSPRDADRDTSDTPNRNEEQS
ncbi:MAG: zinc ribbon domain-containing protein [Ilumatobacteraceae bacterium]